MEEVWKIWMKNAKFKMQIKQEILHKTVLENKHQSNPENK